MKFLVFCQKPVKKTSTVYLTNFCFVAQQTTAMRIETNGCSLPFQYNYQEYNGCINVTGIDTPQCATLNGTLTNCFFPSGM